MPEIVIPLTIEPLEEGGYLATSPIWEDLLAQGRTVSETLEIAQDVARKLTESYLAHGDSLPIEIANAMTKPQTSLHLQIAIPALV